MTSNSEIVGPIIIYRKVKAKSTHHGGAWKVAYADFVTAMMAFFLLMWLLNATTEQQRKGLADYFDPSIPIGRTSSGGRDLLAGDSMTAAESLVYSGKGTRQSRNLAQGREGERGVNSVQEAASGEVDDQFASVLGGVRKLQNEKGLTAHILIREVPDGLLIEIVDTEDASMFPIGSAVPSARMRLILGIVAEAANTVKNELVVIGHADATPFHAGATSDNLDLSVDRAKATRYLLEAQLTAPERIVRVEGRGDMEPLDLDRPQAAINRRVGLLILS